MPIPQAKQLRILEGSFALSRTQAVLDAALDHAK